MDLLTWAIRTTARVARLLVRQREAESARDGATVANMPMKLQAALPDVPGPSNYLQEPVRAHIPRGIFGSIELVGATSGVGRMQSVNGTGSTIFADCAPQF